MSSQDLAFRLVEGTLCDLVEGEWQMSPAEASRIMGDLALSPRTRDAYEWLCSEYGGAALSLVPEQVYSLDSLAQVDCRARAVEARRHLPARHERISIDLDDGVKVNYNKSPKALAKVPGLSDWN